MGKTHFEPRVVPMKSAIRLNPRRRYLTPIGKPASRPLRDAERVKASIAGREVLVSGTVGGQQLLPMQRGLKSAAGTCLVKKPAGWAEMSPAQRRAYTRSKERPWMVEMVFLNENDAKKTGLRPGPALRLCHGIGKGGSLVPVDSPADVVEKTNLYRRCVVEQGGKKDVKAYCAVKVANEVLGRTAPLGGYRRRRRRRRRF